MTRKVRNGDAGKTPELSMERRKVLLGAGALAAASHLPFGVSAPAVAADGAAKTLRLASLRFGSFNWLLDTILAEGFDKEENLELAVRKLATSQGGPVALMSGEADLIVSDWPWAMRQRSRSEAVRFAPYSSSLGAVMVAPDSEFKTLADLKGKRMGVAGSAIDKSWILMRAYAQKTIGIDLANHVTPVFGAPPLLTEEMRSGRLDAVLNFWTFSARLRGAGFRELLTMSTVMTGLGVTPPPPMVGFVWNDAIETKQPDAVPAFLRAVSRANEVLRTSDEAWERLRKSVKAKTDGEFAALIETYRAGIPQDWTPDYTASAQTLLELLKELGSSDLIGAKTKFDPKLFHGTA